MKLKIKDTKKLKWYHIPIFIFWMLTIGVLTIMVMPTIYQLYELEIITEQQYGTIGYFPLLATIALLIWFINKVVWLERSKTENDY